MCKNIILCLFVLIQCSAQCFDGEYRDIIYKRTPNFTEIGTKLGLRVNEHDVVSQDGYILKLFHIPGNASRPVLLMHGIIDSADTFIIRENSSLAIVLANAGYDVWVGNVRGNRYSRRHVFLDPDIDKKFWDFSFHEYGFYDLPAIIDFVLDKTGEKSLSAIGHSLGNTIFYVLGSKREEYNQKIKVIIAVSPISYLSNLKNSVAKLMEAMPAISNFFILIGEEEFVGDDTPIVQGLRVVCGCKKYYELCVNGLFFTIAGRDPEELEPNFFQTVVAHYPTGSSRKTALHVSQIGLRKTFAEFDYERRNNDVYNSTTPPEYDLNKVVMKVVLVAGRNDEISTLDDVHLLRKRLPNTDYIVVGRKKFNHIDAVWGRNMKKYLFPHIFHFLEKYN
ncbi:lipase 3-like [Danaus plexippus]|uniref:lipase 3-like n=1 Tax=Danaus plexippus TaxID=13037 RepID=UPI002AB1E91F|nr:lipase 3-like [Danaus plexippus]